MNNQTSYLAELEQNGFVVLSGILSPSEVELARQDLDNLFQSDLDSRREKGIVEAHYPESPIGHTILTKPSHLALNMYNKSKIFDKLLEQLFCDKNIQQIIKAWSGPNYKIGSVNIRYMTGVFDPPPAHELHRDHPVSMNLGIMLTDVEPGDNGATALVRGSHRTSIDPRWDTLLQAPYRLRKDHNKNGLNFFFRWNIFNRLLNKKWQQSITGAFGKQGDVYFFPNGQVWHGRLPNLHGRRAMICLIGLYEVDEIVLEKPSKVSQEVLEQLPPNLAKGLGGPYVMNDRTNTILEHIQKNRRPSSFFSLEYWARLERKFAEWVSERNMQFKGLLNK